MKLAVLKGIGKMSKHPRTSLENNPYRHRLLNNLLDLGKRSALKNVGHVFQNNISII